MTDEGKLIVYHIHGDPLWAVLDAFDGEEVYQLKAQCSLDGGQTSEIVWLTFDTEDEALAYTRKVNMSMEPTEMGVEDE